MLKAALFDIDGTLIDSNNFHLLAWAEALHEAGYDFRLRELHDQLGQGADNYVRALIPDIGDKEAEALGERHGELFREHYWHRLLPFPNARALLQRCKDEGLAVYLASSASGPELERHLEVLDARELVDGWTSAADVSHSKPCPDIFEAALESAGVDAAQAIVVGDTPFDIKAATKAGLPTIAVRSGLFSDDKLRDAIAVYDDAADLLARFEESPLSRAAVAA